MPARRSYFGTYNLIDQKDTRRDGATHAVYVEFARRLQARMHQLGWNQSDVARRVVEIMPKGKKGSVSFHRDRISQYVRGISLPRPEALTLLAKALGCTQAELIPPKALPAAGSLEPAFSMKEAGGGRVSLHVNRTVTMETATKIVALLSAEDAEG